MFNFFLFCFFVMFCDPAKNKRLQMDGWMDGWMNVMYPMYCTSLYLSHMLTGLIRALLCCLLGVWAAVWHSWYCWRTRSTSTGNSQGTTCKLCVAQAELFLRHWALFLLHRHVPFLLVHACVTGSNRSCYYDSAEWIAKGLGTVNIDWLWWLIQSYIISRSCHWHSDIADTLSKQWWLHNRKTFTWRAARYEYIVLQICWHKQIMFMKVLSHLGHGNCVVLYRRQPVKLFVCWRCFSSHPGGTFSSN